MRKLSKTLCIGCFLLLVFCWISPSFAQAQILAEPALKQGMRGEAVANLQSKLKEYGYYSDEIDGVFGNRTRIAVMDFQMDNNIEADGVVGTQTLDKLRNFRVSQAPSRAKGTSRIGQQIVIFAKQYMGTPYVLGGRSPGGFDCSGFIAYIFAQHGYPVPRMADGQFEVGAWVKRSDLQLGDLVFFTTYEPGASHVGIYIGNNQFIHASSAAGEVTVTPLNRPYYVERYLGARRIAG